MKEDNAIVIKSKNFAIRIIRLYQYLKKDKKEYVLADQILRSGTSIGANIKEAIRAHGRKDFTHKLYIAYKEAGETEYWLELLVETEYITKAEFDSLYTDCNEILRMLTSIIKTTTGTQF